MSIKKSISLLLALLICLSSVVFLMTSCSKKDVMSMDGGDFKVDLYKTEFFMTRMKGILEGYGYDVSSSAWWGTIMNSQGLTVDEYYRTQVLKQVSRYMIAEYLFDKEGLELEKSEKKEISDSIDTLIKWAGSKNKLNSILSQYGVNVKMLEEIYLTELKMQKVKEYYFGADGSKAEDSETRKQEFFEERYVCFKQVFLASYYYETETDKNGDTIYYTDEKTNKIAYDTENGETRADVFNSSKPETDKFGDAVYYTADGKIAYDVTAYPKYLLDKDGNKKVSYHTSQKIDEIEERAKSLASGKKSVEEFESMIAEYSEGKDGNNKIYLLLEDGYYASYGSETAYFDEIAKNLTKMEDGECRVIDSAAGFHVIYKYEHDKGAYNDENYKDIFSEFDDEFVNMLFEEKCAQYEDMISVDNKVLDKLPKMKDVASNILY